MRLNLDGLAAASREALMAEWREIVGRPPPKHLSKPLMVQILSHAYQVDTVYEYIRDHPDCFQKQIADNTGTKKQNVSRNIKILVARGYVVGNNNLGFRITRMLDDLDYSDDQ